MPKLKLNEMVWSFSRVNSFEQCPLGWWYNYHLKINRHVGNAFSDFGTLCHGIIERQMIFRLNGCPTMSNERMREEFQNGFYQMKWGKFPSSDMKRSYLYDGINYFTNWDSFKDYDVKAVEHFVNFQIDGYNCLGGMDLLLEKDGELYLIDHKGTKPYEGEKREKMMKQLYFYCPAIKKEFGKYPDHLGWNFFRKNKLDIMDLDLEKYAETVSWFKETVELLKNTKGFPAKPDPFFCNRICSHRLTCPEKAPWV
jgi:hypothetical protein